MLGTIFMNNLIRGDIDFVDLVSRLTFNVPVRLLRNYYLINLPRCSSNFSQHEPFRVLSSNYNNLFLFNLFLNFYACIKNKNISSFALVLLIYVLSCLYLFYVISSRTVFARNKNGPARNKHVLGVVGATCLYCP